MIPRYEQSQAHQDHVFFKTGPMQYVGLEAQDIGLVNS